MPTGRQAPTRIGREATQKKSNARFLLGCAGSLLLLFVLFVVLMVFVMSRGGGDNAVIQAFGLAPAAIKGFLVTVINLAFGFLALIFFVLTVIGVFRWMGAKRGDNEARKKGIKMFFFSLIPFMLLLVIWVLLYNFIRHLEITAERVVAEIIVTNPKDLTNLQAPLEVSFSAVKVKQALAASQLGVSGATWDLDGDGYFETPVGATGEVTRLYEQRGLFNVGLQVQVVGETAPRTYSFPLTIKDAVFSADPATGTPPLRVQFGAETLIPKGIKMASLDWDFDGDGRYELTGKDNLNPLYTFVQVGTFKVHLRMVDENNNVQNYYRDIVVTPSGTPLLSASIQANPGLKGPAPFLIRFDGGNSSSSKGKITRYSWDFGDGSPLAEGQNVSHTFQTANLYPVTLKVTDDNAIEAHTTVTVEATSVNSPPQAHLKTTPAGASGALGGTLPFKVSFDASDSKDPDNDMVDYQWDFNGDGTPDQSGQKVDYTFETAGDFKATLTVKDSANQLSTDSLAVHVATPGVQAVIKATPTEGTAPLTVHFDGSGSSAYQGSIVSYQWDFGDGSAPSITGATLDHRYGGIGTYTAKLIVTTATGAKAETTQNIFVREIPLRACFTPSRAAGPAPLSVTFDPQCATGAIANYHWNFGDGAESTAHKTAHTFETPGAYTVILEVTDSKNNVNSSSQVITVEPTP